MNKHKNKQKKIYRVRNWREYNEALRQRGSLEFWVSDEVLARWYATPMGTPGAPTVYSAAAIEAALTIRTLFHLPLRQTEGFLTSLFHQLRLTLPVPDYSTLSRRGRFLLVKLPKRRKKKTIVVIDSSGVKVYGEGEWKVRQHGPGKRRKWKKIHIGIDEDGEIRMGKVTDATTGDASVAESLLGQETAQIEAAFMDGAYDKRKVYDACIRKNIPRIAIPPRHDARVWQHGNTKAPPHPRDANLCTIRRHGRAEWKETSGYHQRSLVENTMFRYKTILGDRVRSREDSRQRTELELGFSILNRMFELGMPDSYAVTV
jgi:hypothetical protein